MTFLLQPTKQILSLGIHVQKRMQASSKKSSSWNGKAVESINHDKFVEGEKLKIKISHYLIMTTAFVSFLLFCATIITLLLTHFQKLPLLAPFCFGAATGAALLFTLVLKGGQLAIAEEINTGKDSWT